jgi:hypothetical protein
MIFGPGHVVLVVGANKITDDLNQALLRAKQVAAPMNAIRLKQRTPCTITGNCGECSSEERICRVTTIIEHKPALTPFTVIVVGEEIQMPITINNSVTIKAISFKNGVTSDVGVYSYTINRVDDGGSTSGGSGGSGGTGGATETKQNEIIETKDDSGRLRILVKISPDLVEEELNSQDKSDVTIDATVQDAADTLEVELDAKTLDKV